VALFSKYARTLTFENTGYQKKKATSAGACTEATNPQKSLSVLSVDSIYSRALTFQIFFIVSGTPWARAIAGSCVLSMMIDMGRFGFHFSRVCEDHKFTLFRGLCVAIFACAPALPDRLEFWKVL
jgi:hypothetical protein